uniref:Sugar transporter SWEET n=1 Tax=Globodera pallida TaxID=36090 RepID=A0A183BPX6_GLOPA
MFDSFPLIPANCSATFIKAPANFDLHIQIYKMPYDLLEVQIEQNISFALFFSASGICRQIWKRGDTVEIKPYSFLVGLLGSCYWFVYGVLMQQPLIQYVNVCQFVIYSAYIAFYWTMSRKRCLITSQTVGVFSLVALLFALLPFLGCSVVTPFWRTNALGIVCATLNVASFAAPLTMLKALARAGNTSMLPLPLCLGNLLVSAEWCLFGVLISDLCIVVPNTLGILLSLAQLLLFLVLPRKSKQRAPIVQFCDGIKGLFRRRVFYCTSAAAVTGQRPPTEKVGQEMRNDDKLDN